MQKESRQRAEDVTDLSAKKKLALIQKVRKLKGAKKEDAKRAVNDSILKAKPKPKTGPKPEASP